MLRLAQTEVLVPDWDDPDIYVGFAGRGADEAWFGTALALEHAQAFQQVFCAGAVDIYKCFDQ
eukprot:1124914-Alexandrium_andersonii.AAC.1